jgi:hypothetical protein
MNKTRRRASINPKYIWSVIAVFVVIALCIFSFNRIAVKTHTIVLTNSGFSPQEITIVKGSTIVFRSTSDRAYWPASSFHPSHKLYTDFDAKKPIAVGDEWRFTFTTSGIWRYHDHLNSQLTGTIIVRDPLFTKSENPCTKNDIQKESLSLRERCWIQDIEELLITKGIDRAFERFGSLYETEPAFAADCHDVTHLLGEAAYRAYVRDRVVVTSPKMTYCGYGFYHGFIEALLFGTGNFAQAKAYCQDVHNKMATSVVSSNAIYACYHGLGHGTFDTQSIAKWGDDAHMVELALRTCERVTEGQEEELVKQCATGVFNALANAYGEERYNLIFKPSDPVWVCRQMTNIRYKKACFMEVGLAYVRHMEMDFPQANRWISSLQDRDGEAAVMIGYMADEARVRIDTSSIPLFVGNCTQYMTSSLEPACVEGVVTGLFLWGKPGSEHQKALEFCHALRSRTAHTDVCYSYVLSRLPSLFQKEKMKQICDEVEPEYRQYCRL